MDLGGGTVLLGRYRLDRQLAVGGMGAVWQATDQLLKRAVAVKLMAAQLRLDPVSWERFRREAQYQAALRHPGITEVYDYGEHEGQPFIVMEFLDGGDLHTILRENPGGLPADRAVSLGIQAADALAYLHDSGILHRDIKPANLFLASDLAGRDGQLKVCDFGVAKSRGSASITQAGTRLGTWAYLAPEVWLGEDATASTDLYALGCVLHEVLTGQPPFPVQQDEMAVRQAHLQGQVPAPRGEPPVPGRLSGLVSQLMSKDPQARPASARDVAEELRAIAAGPGDGGAPAAATGPRTRELPPGYYQAVAQAGPAAGSLAGAGPAGAVLAGAGPAAAVLAGAGPAAAVLEHPVVERPVPEGAVLAADGVAADRQARAVAGQPRGQDTARLWTWAARVSAWLVFATTVGLCAAIAAGHLAPEYRLFVLVPAAIYTLPGAVAVSRATFSRPSSGAAPSGAAPSRVAPAGLVFVSLWISEAAVILVASHVRPAEAWSAIMVVAWLAAISATVYYSPSSRP